MDEKICKDCTCFRQHYTLRGGRLTRIYCGHCTAVKARPKKPDAAACERFSPAEPDTESFVEKDYLTKTLLQHFLSLELLPPIQDSED